MKTSSIKVAGRSVISFYNHKIMLFKIGRVQNLRKIV